MDSRTVKLGEEKIQISSFDTLDDLKKKVALELNTLPSYIYDHNLKKVFEGETDEISFKNILDEVEKNRSVLEFLNHKKFSKERLLKIWLLKKNVDPKIVDYIDVKNAGTIVKSQEILQKAFSLNFDRLKNQVSKTQKEQKTMGELKQVTYTEIVVTSTERKTEFELEGLTLLEVFNSIAVDERLPFCYVGDYFKILNAFEPYTEWLTLQKGEEEGDENMLTLFLYHKKGDIQNQEKNFTRVTLREEEDEKTKKIVASYKIEKQKTTMEFSDFVDSFQSYFKKIRLLKTQDISVSATFNLTHQKFNKFIFADFVLNDNSFRKYFSLDESKKVGKTSMHYIFNTEQTGIVKGSLMGTITPEGKEALSFRVSSARDMKAVEDFRTTVARLFSYYNSKWKNVYDFYKKYIPDFKKDAGVSQRKNERRKALFDLEGYSRICQKLQQPTIVDRETALALQKSREGENAAPVMYLKFPREEDITNQNEEPEYYICESKKYPYPGLRPVKNSEKYKVIPCCYQTPQTEKIQKYYKKGRIEEKSERKVSLKTKKFATKGGKGEIPLEVRNKIYSYLNISRDTELKRLGSDVSSSSLLDCILSAETEKEQIDIEKRKAEIIRNRQEVFSDDSIVPLFRQCMYDYTSEGVKGYLRDMSNYLDPRMFAQGFEKIFGLFIFVFNENGIVLPRFKQGFYKYRIRRQGVSIQDTPVIFLYEHKGSERDRTINPQCEIIQIGGKYKFTLGSSVGLSMFSIYDSLLKSYNFKKKIAPYNLYIGGEGGQVLDAYGKCRQVNFFFEGKEITILSSPIAPLMLPEFRKLDVSKTTEELAKKFVASKKGFKILGVTSGKEGNNLKFSFKNGEIFIPLIDSYSGNGDLEGIPELRKSELKGYNKNRRLAYYILQYCYYLFSKFLEEEKVTEITDAVLVTFYQTRMTINKNFEYGSVKKRFSDNSGVLQDGRLVIQNEEMGKRLLYSLKLFSLHNIFEIVDYKNKTMLPNYYTDLSDFKKRVGEVILYGYESLRQWLMRKDKTLFLYSEVKLEEKGPYFFCNKLVENGKIFLAQNVNSLEKAIFLLKTWINRDYNDSIYGGKLPYKNNLTVYAYSSKDNITPITTSSFYPLLGYKVEGKNRYTVLLKP